MQKLRMKDGGKQGKVSVCVEEQKVTGRIMNRAIRAFFGTRGGFGSVRV